MSNQKYIQASEHSYQFDSIPLHYLKMAEHQAESVPSDIAIQSICIGSSSELNNKKVIPRQASASLASSNPQNHNNNKFYQNHNFNKINDQQDNFSSMKRLTLNKPNLKLACVSHKNSQSRVIGCNLQRENRHVQSNGSLEIVNKITYEVPQQFQQDCIRRNTVSTTLKQLFQENKASNALRLRSLKAQNPNKKLCLLDVLHDKNCSSENCSVSESMQNHPEDHLKSEHTFEQSSYPMSLLSSASNPSAEGSENSQIHSTFKHQNINETNLEDTKMQKETYFLDGLIQNKQQKERVNPFVSLNAAREFNKASNLPASSLSQQLAKQRLVVQLKAIIEASRQQTRQKEYIANGKNSQQIACYQTKPLLFKEQYNSTQKNRNKSQTIPEFYTCLSDRRQVYPQESQVISSDKYCPPGHYCPLVATRKDSKEETANDNNRLQINSNQSNSSLDNSDEMNSESPRQCSNVQFVESKILEIVEVQRENIEEASRSCSSSLDSDDDEVQQRICQTSRDNSQLLRMFISEQREQSEKQEDDTEDVNSDFIESKMKACERTLQQVIEEISKKFQSQCQEQLLSPVLSSFLSSILYSLKSIFTENSRKQIQVALNELADVLHRLAVLKDKQGMELSPLAYLGYSTGLHKLSILQYIRTFAQVKQEQHQ